MSAVYQCHAKQKKKVPPHIYAVADDVYHNVVDYKRPQCCIISGESGAGKTESSKFIIQHLLTLTTSVEKELNLKIEQVLCCTQALVAVHKVYASKGEPSIRSIWECTDSHEQQQFSFWQILRAGFHRGRCHFRRYKSSAIMNSKIIILIIVARFKEYLLEKSRIVHQGQGEKNFHIFYAIFSGLSPDEKSKYKLKELSDHR